ncbi:hypothetical protein HHK36_007122 [Tetracentron sinense]|uniref:Uncharacterized protein n=1 Tax=Tetracentron sinense TaxID=13715 RepID=A0A834ZKC6_TETSI|nr:hypothetical protein HHK36_007122 [Tetracentron sinense]
MTHSCSQCGNNGHNSRTCAETCKASCGFMLFGVRVLTEGSIRKSVSMNNLSQYEQPHDSNPDFAAGYDSDGVVHTSTGKRERKRGVPWTEEEHKLFLVGLQEVGKGDWRGISRNFVKSRTPTQVASHAQKYFLRRNNLNRRRRRSSLFDITTDTAQPPPEMNCNQGGFPEPAFPMMLSHASLNAMENPMLGQGDERNISTKLIRPVPVIPVPPASRMADLNLNKKSTVDPSPWSSKLSTSSDQPPSQKHSAFQAISSFNGRDSMIRVA